MDSDGCSAEGGSEEKGVAVEELKKSEESTSQVAIKQKDVGPEAEVIEGTYTDVCEVSEIEESIPNSVPEVNELPAEGSNENPGPADIKKGSDDSPEVVFVADSPEIEVIEETPAAKPKVSPEAVAKALLLEASMKRQAESSSRNSEPPFKVIKSSSAPKPVTSKLPAQATRETAASKAPTGSKGGNGFFSDPDPLPQRRQAAVPPSSAIGPEDCAMGATVTDVPAYTTEEARKLLKGKRILYIGDSIQRTAYKDLVLLLQENRFMTRSENRARAHRTIMKDRLLDGGEFGQLTNDPHYKEVREYVFPIPETPPPLPPMAKVDEQKKDEPEKEKPSEKTEDVKDLEKTEDSEKEVEEFKVEVKEKSEITEKDDDIEVIATIDEDIQEIKKDDEVQEIISDDAIEKKEEESEVEVAETVPEKVETSDEPNEESPNKPIDQENGAKIEDEKVPVESDVTEIKEVKPPPDYHIKFYFITRVWYPYLEKIVKEVEEFKPDVVIACSMLWDIMRYGETFLRNEYERNLDKFFTEMKNHLPETSVLIWANSPPVADRCYGGVFVKQVMNKKPYLKEWHLEAMKITEKAVDKHELDMMDFLGFLYPYQHHLVKDGLHWSSAAHRYMTNIILRHLCDLWEGEGAKLAEKSVTRLEDYKDVYADPDDAYLTDSQHLFDQPGPSSDGLFDHELRTLPIEAYEHPHYRGYPPHPAHDLLFEDEFHPAYPDLMVPTGPAWRRPLHAPPPMLRRHPMHPYPPPMARRAVYHEYYEFEPDIYDEYEDEYVLPSSYMNPSYRIGAGISNYPPRPLMASRTFPGSRPSLAPPPASPFRRDAPFAPRPGGLHGPRAGGPPFKRPAGLLDDDYSSPLGPPPPKMFQQMDPAAASYGASPSRPRMPTASGTFQKSFEERYGGPVGRSSFW